MRGRLLLITVGVIALAAGIWAALAHLPERGEQTAGVEGDGAGRRCPVVLGGVREMVFEERILISGNVEAANTALVSARVAGVIDGVFVDEGDPVKVGQKLFQVDRERLSQAVRIAGEQVAVAAAAVRAREATVTRIRADPAKAQLDLERYKRLYEQDHAVSRDAFEVRLIAVVLVILSLAAVLESFRRTALILVTMPLAVIGVMWSLYLGGFSMDIFVIMGCVMMAGIVVNNAILIVDQFNVHVAEGVPRHKAMIAAACERFRPIVMTTVAAVLGMLPLGVGRGIGAELRNGIGIASVGGILVSGVLTLIAVPVLYDLFTRRTRAPLAKG